MENQILELNNISNGACIDGFESIRDITKDTEQILLMTPRDGYQKKIELISAAKDMTTLEKIKAIDEVEDKYARDLERSTDIYNKMLWAKVRIFLTYAAGTILMISQPRSEKLARYFFKTDV